MTPDCFSLNPRLLLASHVGRGSLPPNAVSFGQRITRWHEIDIITQGGGTDVVNGTPWPLADGDIFYRTPGTVNCHDLPFSCYFFVFDPCFLEGRDYQKNPVHLGSDQPDCLCQPIAPFAFAPGPRLGRARDPEKLVLLCRRIFLEASSGSPDQLGLKIMLLQLIHEISAQLSPSEALPAGSQVRQYWQEIQDLKQWMADNPTQDLSMSRMAERIGVSYCFFSRLFKNITGEAFSSYAIRVRMDYVRLQLLETGKSVAEIALECGYSDPNYLYILFRRVMGCTPTEYRSRISRNMQPDTGVLSR